MKRLASLMLISSLLLTGCTSNGTTEGDNGEIGGVIKVVTGRTDADELFEKIESDFKAMYPEVEDIVWESSADYDNYIMTRMNSTDYGDVLFVPFTMSGTPEEYPNYLESLGTVEDLEKDYIDVTEADYDGNAYGLPAVLNSLGIIYNEEVLKEAGVEKVPTTVEEFVAACEMIKENTDAIPFFTNYKGTAVWGGTLTTFGGEDYRSAMLDAGTAFQEGQPIRQILDLFYELSSKGLIEEDPVTGDFAKAQQMLADGEVAMMMKGSQDSKAIQELDTKGNTISIAPLPAEMDGGTNVAYGASGVVGINKNSENKATAKAFLDFFISKKSGYADDQGGISPLKADLNAEQKELFDDNRIVLTVPTDNPEIDKQYITLAQEVGVARLSDAIQKTINIGLYPEQNESYEDYINSLEKSWSAAVENAK